MIIRVNIYYKDQLTDFFDIKPGSKVQSIDDARYVVISHLDKFYSDVKYKLNLFKPYTGQSEINLYFEENISLSREIKLKQILEND
jgi:hypothetical protein